MFSSCARLGSALAAASRVAVSSLSVGTPALRSAVSARVPVLQAQKRTLSIHEHQSLGIMTRFKVKVMRGKVATTPEAAEIAAQNLRTKHCIVKAQVLAGGRGKGRFLNSGLEGGVHFVKTPADARKLAEKMLGDRLVTKQTGARGARVRRLLIQEAVSGIKRETYFAILMDRASQGPVMLGSPMGGMDIEGVAHDHPEKIFKEAVDIKTGPTAAQLERMASNLGFTGSAAASAVEQMGRLYNLFRECDATQVEINPFIESTENEAVCLDAKLNFDDNADFRQKEIFALRDTSEDDYRDVTAQAAGLNYIGLDGNIGCLVNGAGLAMATMDIIQLRGGSPANFLDVGGGATEQQVTAAFKILSEDARVECVLVNIFGGITKCDTIARAIIVAAREVQLDMPLVVRLQGTNQEAGRALLESSGLNIVAADDLDDAATKAVSAIKVKPAKK